MIYQIHFRIRYSTAYGESVAVRLENTGITGECILYLQSSDGDINYGDFEIPVATPLKAEYQYVICKDGKVTIAEKVYPARRLIWDGNIGELLHADMWRWDLHQLNLGRKAFIGNLFRYQRQEKQVSCQQAGKMIFTVHSLTLPENHKFSIYMTGSSSLLGAWNVDKGIELKRVSAYDYVAVTDIPQSDFEYKYVARYDGKTVWENGNNRYSSCDEHCCTTYVDDGYIRIAELTDWRGAGIVVPLFSLHSDSSDGIGDFSDLRKLVSWAASAGMSVIQLLPICDTNTFGTWRDSYPYNCVSVFALNPIYINLQEAGYDGPHYKCRKNITEVDYEEVYKFKTSVLRNLYDEKKKLLCNDSKYHHFKNENSFWLDAYASYCALRDKYGTLDFSKWKNYEKYDPERVIEDKALCNDAEYYKFLQFIAFSQMKKAAAFALRHRILIKGDIPIGVHPESSDVWKHPDFFNRDMQTGAPPDYFSADGQNWGFPTYNWDLMACDDYQWWRERLAVMSEFFDAYRIDHVLGFFRIWEIPRRYKSGKFGHFNPALDYHTKDLEEAGLSYRDEYTDTLFMKTGEDRYQPAISPFDTNVFRNLKYEQKEIFRKIYSDFYEKRNESLWGDNALTKLKIITGSSPMLPCAEDLGMLPSCVGKVLGKLSILSLQIQSMPKQSGKEFDDVSLYPYESVDTVSTHDMPSFRLWWHKYPDRARRFAFAVFGMTNDIPTEASAYICRALMQSHLDSPSMLCLLSFQDWTSVSPSARAEDISHEQINDPADGEHYWRYRTHLSIEDLEHNKAFTTQIREMIHKSGRDIFR